MCCILLYACNTYTLKSAAYVLRICLCVRLVCSFSFVHRKNVRPSVSHRMRIVEIVCSYSKKCVSVRTYHQNAYPNTVHTHEKHSSLTHSTHTHTNAFVQQRFIPKNQPLSSKCDANGREGRNGKWSLSHSLSLVEHSAFIEEWTTKITKTVENETYSKSEGEKSRRWERAEWKRYSKRNEGLCGKKSKHTKKIWEAMHFSHVLQSRTIRHGITKPEKTDTKTCTHTTHRTHKYKANASCLAVYGMEWVSLSEVRWQRRKRNQVLYCKQIESIYATTNSLTDQRELLMQCLPLPLPYTQRHIVCEMKE